MMMEQHCSQLNCEDETRKTQRWLKDSETLAFCVQRMSRSSTATLDLKSLQNLPRTPFSLPEELVVLLGSLSWLHNTSLYPVKTSRLESNCASDEMVPH